MKRRLKLIVLLTSITTIILLIAHILNNPYFVYANTDNISISTDPEGVLFDADNIKPGDTFERHLTVRNDGEFDFFYQSESKKVNGSDSLYEQLELSVYDSDGANLYEGKLSGFDGFEPRFLESGTEEELTFVAEFPPESGNEFQGLETMFVILFYAEGDMPEQNDEDQEEDPTDADNDKDEEQSSNDESDKDDEHSASVGNDEDQAVKGGSVLPQTGEELPLGYYIIGGLLVVLGVTIYLLRKKRA